VGGGGAGVVRQGACGDRARRRGGGGIEGATVETVGADRRTPLAACRARGHVGAAAMSPWSITGGTGVWWRRLYAN